MWGRSGPIWFSCYAILKGLLICLLTYFYGVPLSAASVPLVLSMPPLLVSMSTYGILLSLSVVPPFLPIYTFDIPHALSVVPPFILVSSHGIPSLRVHPSSSTIYTDIYL